MGEGSSVRLRRKDSGDRKSDNGANTRTCTSKTRVSGSGRASFLRTVLARWLLQPPRFQREAARAVPDCSGVLLVVTDVTHPQAKRV